FGTRLAEAMAEHGPLCVGIDPHEHLLRSWGLPCSAEGVREFALRTVAELKGSVAAVKPQSAFFEQHGSAGVAALEETLAAARDASASSSAPPSAPPRRTWESIPATAAGRSWPPGSEPRARERPNCARSSEPGRWPRSRCWPPPPALCSKQAPTGWLKPPATS